MDKRDQEAQREGALLVSEEEEELLADQDPQLRDDDDDDWDDDEDDDHEDDDHEDDDHEEDDEDDDDWQDDPDDGKAEEAMEVLSGIFTRMSLETRVTVREDSMDQVVLNVSGEDAGRAIGKKGQTLDALQFLVNKIVNRFPEGRRYVVVDSGDYRERHDKGLLSMARREAKRAIEQGRTITLAPMPPRDRRLIHLSLAKFSGVSTRSNGEGTARRIQIVPARSSGSSGGGRRRRN